MADEKKVGAGILGALTLAFLAFYFRGDIKNGFKWVAKIIKEFVEWLEATFDDPELTAAIRDDLGLDPTHAATPPRLDDATKSKIDEFVSKQDLDEAAIVEFFTDLKPVFDEVMAFVDAIRSDSVDVRTLFATMFRLFAVQSLRVRNPAGFALVQLLGFVTSDPETLEQIDAAHLVKLVEGDFTPADGEAFVQRLSSVLGLAVVVTAETWEAADGVFDAIYGWDPDPEDEGQAAVVASRALTVVLDSGISESDRPAITLIAVPAGHGPSGLFLSISSQFEFEVDTEEVRYTMELGGTGHFGVLIRKPPEFAFDAKRSLRLAADPITADGKPDPGPALLLGADDGTRLEIGRLSYGVEVGNEKAAFQLGVRRGLLAVQLGDGDSFLRALPGGSIEAPFGISMIGDTTDGLRFQGGTGLKVNLPITESVFGVFTVQFLELELRLDPALALEIRGGFSFHIGPFAASVDRVGMTIALSEGDPDIEEVPNVIQFAPPRGIGLVLNAGPVKGGGYLFIDSDRGEYAGALELKVFSFSLKAIGLLSTKRPDGTDGWSLLIFVYGQFTIHLGFNIYWTGLGGMVGLHHGSDVEALQAGMKTGALDDVLFPDDPIADAPRIVNRYRTLFPIEESNFLIGPMLELSFSKPPVVYIRLGVILDFRNALQSDADASLSKAILLGQVLVQLPPKDTHAEPVLKLLIDIVGFYEPGNKFLLIRARLRDSFVGTKKVGKITLAGELLVMKQFGAESDWALTAGGFHPRYQALPDRVPRDLERLKVSFKIGKKVKINGELYLARTPNTWQGGLAASVKADLKVASIEASVSLDGILYESPRWYFIIDFQFQAKIKVMGRTLTSVTVTAMLSGPDLWHFTGSFSFKIWKWKKSRSFDESWGELAIGEVGTVVLAATVEEELARAENLTAELPIGGISPITIDTAGETDSIAHPLGRLAIRQRAVPFDLDIDRIGTRRLAGGRQRISVESVKVNGSTAADTQATTADFAKGQFMELTEDERLTGKAFEQYPNGVMVGDPTFAADDKHARDVVAAFETVSLDPEPKGLLSKWQVAGRVLLTETHESALISSHLGAAARSDRAVGRHRLASEHGPDGVSVGDPPLVAVTPGTLVAAVAPNESRSDSPTLFQQTADEQGLDVIEAFEVVG